MSQLTVLMLVSIVLLVLTILFAVWLMNFAAGRIIGKKHKEIETILNTGCAPRSWIDTHVKRMGRPGGKLNEKDGAWILTNREKNKCIRKLRGLIEYCKKSVFIDGEDTRKLLLDDLQAVLKDWENMDVKEIRVGGD